MAHFEKISKYADVELTVPVRGTERSAGYDFEVAEDTVAAQPETIATQPTEYGPITEQPAEDNIPPEVEPQNPGLPILPIFFAGTAIVIVAAIGFVANQRKHKERKE